MALLAFVCASGSARAGEESAGAVAAGDTIVRPTLQATRISEAEAPVIDGDLSDPAWQKAGVIDDFRQWEPDNEVHETEHTVARIMFDGNNLYIGVHVTDSQPELIIGNVKTRDGNLNRDDNVRIFIDPYMTRRNAYSFEVNPIGARTEGLIQNNQAFLTNWDTIWTAKTMRVTDGWVAEYAIPFRNISYDPARSSWGFEIQRKVRRRAETDTWGHHPPGALLNDVAYGGTLTGLSGQNPSGGLDIQTFAGVRYKHQSRGTNDNDITFRPSTNVFYRITPSLTGTLTVNTDFSDAPLDRRQVNTTRFSLFTEETRQFFLQDVANFEFGGAAFTNGRDNARPFFSRNLGLVSGRPVPIIVGGKLSGDIAGMSLGLLTVLSDGTDTTDGQNLTVLRGTVPLGGESRAGFVVTHGDPTGATTNTVAGIDMQYTDADFFGPRQRLTVDSAVERSFSDANGDDNTYAVSMVAPTEPVGGEFHFKQVGPNFTPTLGFANRKGIRLYDGTAKYRQRFPNTFFLNYIDFGVEGTMYTHLDNNIESRDMGVYYRFQTENNDSTEGHLIDTVEKVDAPFNLPGGITVPAGNYHWTHINFLGRTTQSRTWLANVDIDCCTYYNGDYLKANLGLDVILSETWAFNITHNMTLLHFPTGHTNIHIDELKVTTNFTPDMHIDTQIQYDNITKRFAFLARYFWEYEPGSEIFASIGEQGILNGPIFTPHYTSDNTQAYIRIGHTIQY